MNTVKNTKKKWLIVLSAFILMICIAGIGVGNYFVNYALSPASNSDEREINQEDIIAQDNTDTIALNKEKEKALGADFEKNTLSASIKSTDGLTLNAAYRDGHRSDIWILILHGYKSDKSRMMEFGHAYYSKGYNVLLPDNRAHGDSEGNYIGMGWLDKDDASLWIDWIKSKNNNAKVIVHGLSMGAATTMMLSGENNPHIIGYIEDCGYTSAWDIFCSELDKRFSLPPFPIMHISNIVANFKAGYDFKKASSLEQVKKCSKPMLFIHGAKDDFVPVDMVHILYSNAICTKDIFIVDDAGHAESKDCNPEAYWNKVFSFIEKNILQ